MKFPLRACLLSVKSAKMAEGDDEKKSSSDGNDGTSDTPVVKEADLVRNSFRYNRIFLGR